MNKLYNPTVSDALLITDIQIDFLPGGALPVENGDRILPIIRDYIKIFESRKAHIIASRDWHPSNHISFKAQGGPWPPHCVENTTGAQFSPDLKLPENTIIISKATESDKEAYSAFDGTNLALQLQQLGIKRLFVAGFATDYCIVNTVLDASKLGFEVIVLMDATLGINLKSGDVDQAIESMQNSGAGQATELDFPASIDTLPLEEVEFDQLADEATVIAAEKKQARMRPKGANKRLPSEK